MEFSNISKEKVIELYKKYYDDNVEGLEEKLVNLKEFYDKEFKTSKIEENQVSFSKEKDGITTEVIIRRELGINYSFGIFLEKKLKIKIVGNDNERYIDTILRKNIENENDLFEGFVPNDKNTRVLKIGKSGIAHLVEKDGKIFCDGYEFDYIKEIFCDGPQGNYTRYEVVYKK